MKEILILICIFYSTFIQAANWEDVSKNKDQSMMIDFDSITSLPNPKRVIFQYKNISNTENIANVVILCDSAQYYLDSISVKRFDGTIVGINNEDSPKDSIIKNTLFYAMYENYCSK